jgi:hypothetical protein
MNPMTSAAAECRTGVLGRLRKLGTAAAAVMPSLIWRHRAQAAGAVLPSAPLAARLS